MPSIFGHPLPLGASLFCFRAPSRQHLGAHAGAFLPPRLSVAREDLRYLQLLHVDADGHTRQGEMVVHRDVADAVVDIFRALYEARYPIERMRIVDHYGASDRRSMLANNTSAFNHRRVAGTKKLSQHSYGRAIDLNPFYNPYVKRRRDGSLRVDPAEAEPYADRSRSFPMKLTAKSLPVRLFKRHGFSWGGDWRTLKDYQHFEMPAD